MIRPVAAAVLALATTVMRLSTSDSDRLSDFDAFWPKAARSLLVTTIQKRARPMRLCRQLSLLTSH